MWVEKVGLLQLQGSRFWVFRCGYIAFMTYIHCHTIIPKVKGTEGHAGEALNMKP